MRVLRASSRGALMSLARFSSFMLLDRCSGTGTQLRPSRRLRRGRHRRAVDGHSRAVLSITYPDVPSTGDSGVRIRRRAAPTADVFAQFTAPASPVGPGDEKRVGPPGNRTASRREHSAHSLAGATPGREAASPSLFIRTRWC